jgi:hypothetical protein
MSKDTIDVILDAVDERRAELEHQEVLEVEHLGHDAQQFLMQLDKFGAPRTILNSHEL